MSAFLCSDRHISTIAAFANRTFVNYRTVAGHLPQLSEPEEIAKILHAANVASVNYRYPLHASDSAPEFKWANPAPITHVEFIKAIDCLAYQSCERPDWDESDACRILQFLKNLAVSSLPGYDSAPWGID